MQIVGAGGAFSLKGKEEDRFVSLADVFVDQSLFVFFFFFFLLSFVIRLEARKESFEKYLEMGT